MFSLNRFRMALALHAAALCFSGAAGATDLLNTGAPTSSVGFDVSTQQTTAIAFTTDQAYRFDSVSLWMMSNNWDCACASLTISLQSSIAGSSSPLIPSGVTLESWSFTSSAVGWTPVLETMQSVLHPVLGAGETFWIVAQSSNPSPENPVWVTVVSETPHLGGNINTASGPQWEVGYTTWTPAAVVTATPVPEPATLALGLIGLPVVLRLARRRAAA